MFGSGRAILTLRDSWRRDLREVKQITGFKYVRFHAILHDEVGVYDEDNDGKPIYNFSYVDQIYDGLLAARHEAICRNQLHAEEAGLARRAFSVLVQAQQHAAQGLRQVGRPRSRSSASTSSSATASTKSPRGTSKSGMSPTSISGPAIRSRRHISSSTTTLPRL